MSKTEKEYEITRKRESVFIRLNKSLYEPLISSIFNEITKNLKNGTGSFTIIKNKHGKTMIDIRKLVDELVMSGRLQALIDDVLAKVDTSEGEQND